MSNVYQHHDASTNGARQAAAALKPYLAQADEHQHLQWIGAGRRTGRDERQDYRGY